jgi:hypothetical protein
VIVPLMRHAGWVRVNPVVAKRIMLVVAVLGAFLPWATLGDYRATGTSTTQGMIVLLAAGIGLLLTFSTPVDPKARTFEFVLVACAVLAPTYYYVRTFTGSDRPPGLSPGYGLFLCLPAGVVWLGWFLWGSRGTTRYRKRRPPRRLDDWG